MISYISLHTLMQGKGAQGSSSPHLILLSFKEFTFRKRVCLVFLYSAEAKLFVLFKPTAKKSHVKIIKMASLLNVDLENLNLNLPDVVAEAAVQGNLLWSIDNKTVKDRKNL